MTGAPAATAEQADDRIPTAVVGATGIVGQRLANLLEAHPWFRLAEVAASDRSAGRRYGEAVAWSAEASSGGSWRSWRGARRS